MCYTRALNLLYWNSGCSRCVILGLEMCYTGIVVARDVLYWGSKSVILE